MSPAKFREYIDNPVNLTKADEADLKELLQEFPYFNAGQVMLSKIYKNEQNFRFERQLKLAAMYAGDRTKLFDYLNAEPVKDETVAEKETIPEPPKVEVKQEVVIPEPIVEVKEQELPNQELVEEKQEVEEKIEEVQKPLTRFTLATDEEVTEVEEEVSEPINLNTTVHIKPDIQVEEKEDVIEQDEEIKEQEVPEYNIEEVFNQQEVEEKIEEEPVAEAKEEEKEEEKSEAVSFYDWLALKGKREEEAKIEEEKAETEPEKKVDIDSIIGKFLNEQPTISRPKAEFYNPTDMAKRSVEDNNDIVTESLAKLYLKQHLYTKAITVYEKLCLLIPEKSETFASQIKKIKEEHNID